LRLSRAELAWNEVSGKGLREKTLTDEMREAGLSVAQQKSISVCYNGIVAGVYVADLVVEETVVIGLKDIKPLDPAYIAQWMTI
jgi:GxxExxY protein